MASFLDTVKSALSKTGDAIVWAWKKVKQDFTDYYGDQDLSWNVNKVIWDIWKYGKQWSAAIGWLIDTGLDKAWVKDSNFRWVLGWIGWSVSSVPQNIVTSLREGIEWAAETQWLISAWDYKWATAKAAKTGASTALGVLGNITGIPIYINAGLAWAGLDTAVAEWTQTLKSWLSTTMQKAWFDKSFSDDIGSAAIDGISFYLMKKGGEKSANIWGRAKVQSFKDTIRQWEILDTVRAKASAVEWATPASIAAAVERARPFVENAKASGVTLSDIAKNNINSLGYDVAYNSVIPVLWLAVKAVEDGEYKDLSEAFGSNVFSSVVAGMVPGFKGIKAMKNKPSPDQTALDMNAKVEAPEVKVEETTTPVKDESTTAIEDAKRFSSYTEPKPKGKSKTKDPVAPQPTLMTDYKKVNEFIASKQAAEAETKRLADEFNAMNTKQDQATTDFVAKQDVQWEALQQKVFSKLLAESDVRAGMKEDLDTLTAQREADTKAFADILNTKQPDSFNAFMGTNPTAEQGIQANILIKRNAEGIGNITKELREDTILTPEQKNLLMQSVVSDNIDTQKWFLNTIKSSTPDATVKDLPFTSAERESAGTATTQDKFSRRMDQRKEVGATEYRVKAGTNKVAATGYKNVSDDVALNNITRVLPDGKVVDEGNYLFNSAKAVEADTQNAVYESAWLTRQELSPILSWNKKIDQNDLLGKRTEYYDTEITPENVGQFMKATIENAKWMEGTNPNLQKWEATNIVRASALYSFIKWDPQLVAKYFTPDQVAVLSKYDKDNVISTQQWLGDYSVTRGVFPQGMRSDGYMRLVMTPENYKDTPKTVQQSITMDIGWGQTRTFKDALDAESFVRIALARGETLTPDMMKFSSLSKEQAGASLDPYRIHWGIASMLSYGKALGEAYKSKHLATELSELGKADTTKAYMDNIRRNFFGSDLEQRILWIDTLGEWTAQKIANTIGWIGTAKAIIGNVGTYTKGWLSATGKNIAEWWVSALTNTLKWNFGTAMRDVWDTLMSIPGTLTGFARTNVWGMIGTAIDKAMGKESVGRNVQTALAKEWFITGHEVSEHIGWAMSKATGFFSSIRQENAAKTALALRSMRRTLLDNGYKVWNADSVVKAWEQFRNEKPNEYTYARNNIYADTTLMGNVSKQSRLGFLGMQRILGPIKWFATGLVGSTVNDTRNIYSEVKNALAGKWIDLERTGWAAKRLILNTATPVLLYSTIYDSLPDDMDEKAKDLIAKTWQEMIWQNPIESTISWIGSLPSAIGVDAVNDLLNLTASQIDTYTKMQEGGRTKVDTMKAMAGKGLDDIRRSLAAVDYLNRASDIPGETLQEKITSALGTVNRENMTEFWTNKGSSTDSTMEAIGNVLGFSIDNPMNALLRKPDKILDTTDMTIKRWLMDFLSPAKTWKNADIGYQWWQAMDSYTDVLNTTWEVVKAGAVWLWLIEENKNKDDTKTPSAWDRVLMQQNVYDILTAIDGQKKPFSQVLSDIDVDPRMTAVIENQAWKYLVSIAKANDTVEKWLWWKFDPKKIKNDGYMQEVLQDIHNKNPRAYNDFVGWLAEIRNSTKDFDYTQLKKDAKGDVSFADKSADAYFDSLAAKLNESTAVQDGAIADYYDEKSLTTSAIKAGFEALGTIDSKKMTADEINKKLSEVNAYLTFIDKNSNYTGNHTNAAALETFKIAKSLVDANKLGKFIDGTKFPMLWTYVKNALDLRWEDVPRAKSIWSVVSGWNGIAKKWFASTISSTLSSDLPTVWTEKKKDSKIKLQSGSVKKMPTKWVWPVKSLAEILWVNRQPQVWQQSINDLKRNQYLATFAKPMNPTKI